MESYMKLRATWKKSVSDFVVGQELVYKINDVQTETALLDKDTETFVFSGLVEGDTIFVSLRAYSSFKYSEPLVGSYTLAVQPVPEAPTDLVWEELPDDTV